MKLLPLAIVGGSAINLLGQGVHFDPTINLSGVLAALTCVMAVFAAWVGVPRRVTSLEKTSDEKIKLIEELQKNSIVMAETMKSLAKDMERIELLVSRHILNSITPEHGRNREH